MREVEANNFLQVRFDGTRDVTTPLFTELFHIGEQSDTVAHAAWEEAEMNAPTFGIESMVDDQLPIEPKEELPTNDKFFQRYEQNIGNIFIEANNFAVGIEDFDMPITFRDLEPQAAIKIESQAGASGFDG